MTLLIKKTDETETTTLIEQFFFFFFLVVLGFELRSLCLLRRWSCHLSHSSRENETILSAYFLNVE
jgi:hypothetical protein